MAKGKEKSLSTVISEFIHSRIASFLTAQSSTISALKDIYEKTIPDDIRKSVELILTSKSRSYREGLVVQLAYGLNGINDITTCHEGARTVGRKLGVFLSARHIEATRDAYQCIGKNTDNLIRGNNENWDKSITWLSHKDRTTEERKLIFEYACSFLASESRPVNPMPELDLTALRFAPLMILFRRLYAKGSGGAFEQFSISALIETLIGQTGIKGIHTHTKNINASDRSSKAAGDVQVYHGVKLTEAFEVTANNWRTKIEDSAKTIKGNDLSRLHIVARVPEAEKAGMYPEIAALEEEVTVADLEGMTGVLVSILDRRNRAVALERLYEHLNRQQIDIQNVNYYTWLIVEMGLAVQKPKPN